MDNSDSANGCLAATGDVCSACSSSNSSISTCTNKQARFNNNTSNTCSKTMGSCIRVKEVPHVSQKSVKNNTTRVQPQSFNASLLTAFNPEDAMSRHVLVQLDKQEGTSLGITVSGGIDKGSYSYISYIRPNSLSDKADCLLVGDKIVAVNNIQTLDMQHDEIIALLKNSGNRLILELRYILPCSLRLPQATSKRIELILEKASGDGLGLVVRGGKCQDAKQSSPLVIMNVRPGSAADKNGRIKVGDRIISINGISMQQGSSEEAMSIFKNSQYEIAMVIEYDVGCLGEFPTPDKPSLFFINKSPKEDLGILFTKKTNNNGEELLCIDSIDDASIADRCGALKSGDVVLSIDGQKTGDMTAQEADELIKNNSLKQIRLEVLPCPSDKDVSNVNYGQFQKLEIAPTTSAVNMRPMTPARMSSNTLPSIRRSVKSQPDLFQCDGCDSENQYQYSTLPHNNGGTVHNTDKYGGTTAGYSDLTIAHKECIEVYLTADSNGSLGFTLKGNGEHPDSFLTACPYIDYVEIGGPADKTGCILRGDLIQEIDHIQTIGRSMDDIITQISLCQGACTLLTSFTVADAVVPSCGVFNLKIRKSGGGIGITLNAKERLPGHPLLITAVKPGSPAYRTGTIHPGDYLVGIGSFNTAACTIEEAAMILANTDDVVSLRIQKVEQEIKEVHACQCQRIIEATLYRKATTDQWGITISGSDESFEPITIESLMPGGLAEQCEQFMPNDQILAINGVPMYGKTVTEATNMLHTAGLSAALKVARVSKCDVGSYETMNFGSGRNNAASSMQNCLPQMSTYRLPPYMHANYNLQQSILTKRVPSKDSAVDCSGDLHTTESDSSKSTSSPRTTNQQHPPILSLSNHNSSNNSVHFSYNNNAILSQHLAHLPDPNNLNACNGSSNASLNCPVCRDAMLNELKKQQIQEQQQYFLRMQLRQQHQQEFLQQRIVQHSRSDTRIKEVTPPSSGCMPIKQPARDNSNLTEQQQMLVTNSNQHQIHQETVVVNISKKSKKETFGLGVSEAILESGVFISAIQPGSPAERCGSLKLYDRILQVNGVNITGMKCKHVVSLISKSVFQLELAVLRRSAVINMPAVYNVPTSEEHRTATIQAPNMH